ncbi:unnamed protein product [Protopolystoma xenopodis]|uniref:Secreted protein n=1 Tax=Protopolystoma xenopodis TaxID=117903 RepID=A0A3S5CR60_9PLAT|nr:unnamed protein product [Protopolystoma xenopodis]
MDTHFSLLTVAASAVLSLPHAANETCLFFGWPESEILPTGEHLPSAAAAKANSSLATSDSATGRGEFFDDSASEQGAWMRPVACFTALSLLADLPSNLAAQGRMFYPVSSQQTPTNIPITASSTIWRRLVVGSVHLPSIESRSPQWVPSAAEACLLALHHLWFAVLQAFCSDELLTKLISVSHFIIKFTFVGICSTPQSIILFWCISK